MKDPTCSKCNDTHRMTLGERGIVPCTRCPTPCERCRRPLGAYCDVTPCPCVCHIRTDERLTLDNLLALLAERVRDVAESWPPYNSAHEGFGVLLEEVDELKAHVWKKQSQRDLAAMRAEALDVATVALRFALDVCNERAGRR